MEIVRGYKMIRKKREIKSVEDEIWIQHYMLFVSGN
jgi:hypothetical protein